MSEEFSSRCYSLGSAKQNAPDENEEWAFNLKREIVNNEFHQFIQFHKDLSRAEAWKCRRKKKNQQKLGLNGEEHRRWSFLAIITSLIGWNVRITLVRAIKPHDKIAEASECFHSSPQALETFASFVCWTHKVTQDKGFSNWTFRCWKSVFDSFRFNSESHSAQNVGVCWN